MKKSKALADRLREVILNGTWIANTNFKHQLTGTDWQTATRSIANLNSMAVLAQHIDYYIAGINNVFKGGTLDISDRYSFDFAPITSQQQWESVLEKFWKDAEEFAALVEKIDDEQLEQAFVDVKYGTFLRNIDGMIEHAYYHLGQVVLIKKMLG
ncbi:DUF1572 family protein [Flavobacterium caeni]|uniref:DUF1572 domain-containing protein n=1 Tax=Flavobacterium caeni TaxID=490189 RepID=A0A1G5IS40_9FLAO|nr:DUF1572 family protein [Flavobacterium caeni]SCY78902.1 Protein of unknown function [Flavobacterium caeni]